jgi:DNA helicase II / ATP-dependent DNA helicase PcrA
MQLLNELNDEQRAAASWEGQPAGIIGVPGSGKTKTITALCANLVTKGVPADKILAMTFTRNAAGEMNKRLTAVGIVDARVGTIHSVANQLLRGARPDLVDSGRLDEGGWLLERELKVVLRTMRRAKSIPTRGVDFGEVKSFISRCKLEGPVYIVGDPFRMNAQADYYISRLADDWIGRTGLSARQALQVFSEAEKARAGKHLFSFDDMINWAWSVLITDPDALAFWSERWTHVIVDEIQDSSVMLWDIPRLLTGLGSLVLPEVKPDGAQNLIVGGDCSQSIYGFNGGRPEILLDYCKSLPEGRLFVLPRNYRSVPQVCSVSTALVTDKEWHIAGEIKPVRGAPAEGGAAVELRRYAHSSEECADIVNRALEHVAAGGRLRDLVVLSRLSSGLHMLELECIRRRVPYIKMAAGSFFESKEVKDLLAYLRIGALHDPNGLHLRHIINTPFRYIGATTITQAETLAEERGIALLDALLRMKLSPPQTRALSDLRDLLLDINRMACEGEKLKAERATKPGGSTEWPAAPDLEDSTEAFGPAAMLAEVLERTDYVEAMRQDEGLTTTDESKLVILAELQRIASQFASCSDFLSFVDMVAEAVRQAKLKGGLRKKDDEEVDALVLSTVHRCKGLEWLKVFVVDVSPGRFPCSRAEDLDEELRLFYVAVTRAKDYVQVSYALDATSAHTDGPSVSIFTQKLASILKACPQV